MRTITKIVGVIPPFVRILVGVLLALAFGLAVRSRLSAHRARRLERQRAQLLEDVGLLQAALLPVPPARIGPVGASVAYRPADGPAAGGDFYDVFAREDGVLCAIVGDVSGHGRQDLPHTALLRFTLRAYMEAGLSPREALRTAGAVLERQLGQSLATVLALTYDPRERVLTHACAGHPPPIVLGRESHIVPVTACASPPIGAGRPTGARQTVVSLPGSARVCLHTDGLTEARLAGQELFGQERLTEVVRALEPGAGAATLLDRIAEQTDARPDDMAACLLTIDGDAHAPHVLAEQLVLRRGEADRSRLERFLAACGVEEGHMARSIDSARIALEGPDAVLLEVRPSGGEVDVALLADNVRPLPIPAVAAAGALPSQAIPAGALASQMTAAGVSQ